MSQDALAKAREIAARLSGGIVSDLGKRKNKWDDDQGAIIKKKIYIPAQTNPDINFLGLLIGPKGAMQKHMSEVSGAKIVIRGLGASKDGGPSNTGHPDDTDQLHVYIEGSEGAVAKATAEVEQILYNPDQANRLKAEQLKHLAEMNGSESIYGGASIALSSGGGTEPYQIELRVPNNMVGLIIGKGGENIVRIQTQLGVNAQIAKEHEMLPGETLRSIVLKGSPANVSEAKSRIDDIINAQLARTSAVSTSAGLGYNKELDNSFVVKLPVPNDKVGIIIGKGGMTIKGIQERTRAQVQIPAGPDDDNKDVRTLSIGGDTKEAVDAAQMEIFMALQQQQQNARDAYNSSAAALQMLVPDDKVGIIIGKGGMTVKDIQNRLRVKVQIPQTADIGSMPPMRTISIVGPADMQPTARYEIEMILAGTPVHGAPSPSSSSIYGGGTYGGAGGYGVTQYGAAAAAGLWGQQQPLYGAAGGYYGAQQSMNPYMMQQQQQPYGMQQPYGATTAGNYYGASSTEAGQYMTAGQQIYDPTAATAAAGSTAAVAEPDLTDPTAFYNDFWTYCSYYGEAAARIYYTAWAPPVGTLPPAGIVVAPDTAEAIAAATAAVGGADATATSTTGGSATTTIQSTGGEDVSSYTSSESSSEYGNKVVDQNATTATTNTANEVQQQTAGDGNNSVSGNSEDSETEAAAWEAYKQQYAIWYEAYGKASGADPNPPQQK